MLVVSGILSSAYQIWLDMQNPWFLVEFCFLRLEAKTLMHLFPSAPMQSRSHVETSKNSRFLWPSSVKGDKFFFKKIGEASSGFHMLLWVQANSCQWIFHRGDAIVQPVQQAVFGHEVSTPPQPNHHCSTSSGPAELLTLSQFTT